MRSTSRLVTAILVATLASATPATALTAAVSHAPPPGAVSTVDEGERWEWPVLGPMTKPYIQPAHAYAPGHRGIDIRATTPEIRAPAAGTVVYVGVVVDRPLITVDHGGGLVSTLEPVSSELAAGAQVAPGQELGAVSTGGHTASGDVHLGVRLDGSYINPLLLLGDVPRAVLLPCC